MKKENEINFYGITERVYQEIIKILINDDKYLELVKPLITVGIYQDVPSVYNNNSDMEFLSIVIPIGIRTEEDVKNYDGVSYYSFNIYINGYCALYLNDDIHMKMPHALKIYKLILDNFNNITV